VNALIFILDIHLSSVPQANDEAEQQKLDGMVTAVDEP
jgi:hypothetical protein